MNTKKVVAYVRVSTDNIEQINSLESQKKYYIDKISNNKEWIFAGIYSDEGISGTQTKNRNPFSKIIRCGFCGGKYTRRIMTNRTNGIPIWDCMRNVKSSIDSCSLCKALREELISSCFADGLQLLVKNKNSYVLNLLKDYIESIRNENNYNYMKNKISVILKNNNIDEFNSDIFRILIDHIIIGGYIDGEIDKCIIRFILKNNYAIGNNGIDEEFIVKNNQINNGKSNDYVPILDFNDTQRYYLYQKDENGKAHKILMNKIKVRFEYINTY